MRQLDCDLKGGGSRGIIVVVIVLMMMLVLVLVLIVGVVMDSVTQRLVSIMYTCTRQCLDSALQLP